MNIALFTDFYFPSTGGVQTSVHNQRKVLEAAGHTVYIFTIRYDLTKEHDERLVRLPTLRFMKFEQHPGFLPWWWIRRRLHRQLQEYKIDIVHLNSEMTVALMAMRVAKSLGLPVVYTAHTLLWRQINTIHRYPRLLTAVAVLATIAYWRRLLATTPRLADETWQEWHWRRLVLSFASEADVTTTPSGHLAEKLKAWGCKSKVIVNPNGIGGVIKSSPLPGTITFLWAALLTPVKQPLLFLDALEILQHQTNKPFTAVMLGRGPLLGAVRRRLPRLPMVSLCSDVPYERMPEFYKLSSAVVSTSYRFDNQPMIIAEALLAGRGVIYIDDDLKEGIEGAAGLLAATPDAKGLANALRRAVEEPGMLERMSKGAQSASALFSLAAFSSRLEAVYKEAQHQAKLDTPQSNKQKK